MSASTDIRIAPSASRNFVVPALNLKNLALIGAVAIIYFVAGKLGLYFAAYNPSSSPLWPAAGIAIVALLLGGFRFWPAVFLGAFFVNVTTSGPSLTSLGIATGNTLEALVGAYLTMRYANGGKMLERVQDFFKFVAIILFASAVSPTIGLTSLVAGGFAHWHQFIRSWLTWWLGDVGGFILVAPFLILWIENPRISGDRRRMVELSLTFAAIALVGVFVFGGALPGVGNYPIGFTCIPILVWAAFRFGQREAATANVILAASATWGITRGLGPWARYASPVSSFILPQAFVITMSVMTLAMAAAVWERKRAEAAAKDADRAKDQFLAMLGHELRNPIGALVSAVRVLESSNVHIEQAAKVREIIARQSSHLARLVDDLVDIGRLTTGTITLNRRPINIDECARDYVATLRFSEDYAARNISLETAEVWIEGDPDRFEQILANLFSNARKHTRRGGKICLTVRPEGDRAVIRVEDDGDGISPDLLSRIFDRFVQGDQESDRRLGGLGLGLTLVRRLVELHGGTVEAYSDGAGCGSSFVINMPRVAVTRRHPMRSPAPTCSDPGRRILIVEDNTDARESLRLLLEQNGHEVFEADSGPSGVASALANRPDVVLIDVGLPGFDGYEAARRIRSASQDGIVLIALTGYGLPEDRRRAQQAGFDAHLVKPFDPDSLSHLLKGA
jgi:signal transduction histidine kinase